MRQTPAFLVFITLLYAPALLPAQEPALFSSVQAIRFEESPDFFHYVYPCKSPAGFDAEMPKNDPFAIDREPAICWPIAALKMVKVDGRYEALPAVQGQLVVAQHNIRFLPNDPKVADHYADILPTEARFEHQSGQIFAFFGNDSAFFKFGFLNLCPTCTAGATIPATVNPAQLESEFALVSDSFKHFDATLKHVQDLAASLRVEFNATNQPGPGDPHEAMGLYAALNDRLAPLCAEPARSCVETFAKYEAACAKAASASDCPAPPSCTAACNLSAENFHSLPAMFCTQADKAGATAIPDWTEVLEKQHQADKPANPPTKPVTVQANGHTIQLISAGPQPPRTFRPGTIDMQLVRNPNSPPSVGCTVKASYERASLPDAGFGVMGMGAAPGSVFGQATPPPTNVPSTGANGVAGRKIAITAGTAQGNLISRVQPVYPPVARAARVSGTVVLSATISKEGAIENLRVVSGPPMLQQAALDAVSKWQYKPYLLNGQPVEVDTTVNVVFNLGPDPAATPASGQQPAASPPAPQQ